MKKIGGFKVGDYKRLLMGLISGFSLILLNHGMIKESINEVSLLFDPSKTDTLLFDVGIWLSRICTILSFLGDLVVIGFSILILQKVLFNSKG